MLRYVLLLSVTLMMAGVLSACGGTSANPIQKYSDLKTVPANNQVQPTQSEMTSPFVVDVEGANDVNFASFVENEESTVAFRVRNLQPEEITKYEVTALGLPPGAQFARSSQDPNVWVLKWKPARGTVPSLSFNKVFSIRLQVTVPANGTTNSYFANVAVLGSPFTIVVSKTHDIPVISGLNNLGTEVNEGDVIPFTVEINDPSQSATAPKIEFVPYDLKPNLENYKGDGSKFIVAHPSADAQQVSPGVWRINRVFDTKNKTLPYPLDRHGQPDKSADSLNACFVIRVENALKVPADQNHCVKIKYAAQPAVIAFDGVSAAALQTTSSQVVTGQANTIKFTVRSISPNSTVSVQNQTLGFSTWTGKPSLDCKAAGNDASVMNCELDWNVPCSTKVGKRTLTLKLTTKAGEREVSTQFKRDIEITPAPATACQAPAKPAAATKTAPTQAAPQKAAAAEKTPAKAATPAAPAAPAAPAKPAAKPATQNAKAQGDAK